MEVSRRQLNDGGRGSHSRFDASRAKERVVQGTKASKRSMESWWKDPETKRKRRVAKYKFYTVEGKVKHSLKKGYKWIKNRCAKIMSGF